MLDTQKAITKIKIVVRKVEGKKQDFENSPED